MQDMSGQLIMPFQCGAPVYTQSCLHSTLCTLHLIHSCLHISTLTSPHLNPLTSTSPLSHPPSHLHIFTLHPHISTSPHSHLHIYTLMHPHISTSPPSHIHIFTHLHIFMHPHTSTSPPSCTLTPPHLHPHTSTSHSHPPRPPSYLCRFQKSDMLSLLLTPASSDAHKRLPSQSNPDLAASIREEVAMRLQPHKGDWPCYFFTQLTTFTLPAGEGGREGGREGGCCVLCGSFHVCSCLLASHLQTCSSSARPCKRKF